MSRERHREVSRKGGAAAPPEKRTFSTNRMVAIKAGKKGGRAVSPEKRSFSQNRALASAAGRKGGRAAHGILEY
jgi:uncharacterized protein